jgi:hypothetical protein
MGHGESPRFDRPTGLTEWSVIEAASRRLPSIKYALGAVAIFGCRRLPKIATRSAGTLTFDLNLKPFVLAAA